MTTSDMLFLMRSYLVNLPVHEREEIMDELAAHLEDKAASLRAQGRPDADADAVAAFGDPGHIGAQLADVHSRPTQRQLALAVLPFIMNGLLAPALVLAVATLDRLLGPMPDKTLRLLSLRLYHPEAVALLIVATLSLMAVFALGALVGLRRGLPLWSASWVGSAAFVVMLLLPLILDESPQSALVLANLVFVVALTAGLIAISRRRSGLLALLIALSVMLQARIFSLYALFDSALAFPVSDAVVGFAVSVVLVAVACVAIIAMLQRPSSYLAIALAAALFSLTPDLLVGALGGDAPSLPGFIVDMLLPTLLILVLPYALRRRDPALH